MRRSTQATLLFTVLVGASLFAAGTASADRLEWRDREARNHQPQRQNRVDHRQRNTTRVVVDQRIDSSQHFKFRGRQQPVTRVQTVTRHHREVLPTHRYNHQPRYRDTRPAPRYHRPAQRWVPGHYVRQYCPPVYRYVTQACGTQVRILVRQGTYQNVWVPGRYVSYRY